MSSADGGSDPTTQSVQADAAAPESDSDPSPDGEAKPAAIMVDVERADEGAGDGNAGDTDGSSADSSTGTDSSATLTSGGTDSTAAPTTASTAPPATAPEPTEATTTTAPPTTVATTPAPSAETRPELLLLSLPTYGGGTFDPNSAAGKNVILWFWGAH